MAPKLRKWVQHVQIQKAKKNSLPTTGKIYFIIYQYILAVTKKGGQKKTYENGLRK